MKLVLDTAWQPTWAEPMGELSLATFPVGNRPLFELWLELAVQLGVDEEVCVVLGHGARGVEEMLGDGARWGVTIRYQFVRDPGLGVGFLRRSPARWKDGVLYVAGSLFPRKGADFAAEADAPGFLHACADEGASRFLLDRDGSRLGPWLDGEGELPEEAWEACGFEAEPIADVPALYTLNMRMLDGEWERHVQPGYGLREGAFVGYDAVLPPSAELSAPLAIGNHCRLGALCTVGRAVLGDRVIVDDASEVRDAVVFPNTYIGRNLEVRGKVVCGRTVFDGASGIRVDFDEEWLFAAVEPRLGDGLRLALHALAALLLLVIWLPLFLLGLPLLPWFRGACRDERLRDRRGVLRTVPRVRAGGPRPRLARLGGLLMLDRYLALRHVLLFRFFLVGQPPRREDEEADAPLAFPGLFSADDLAVVSARDVDRDYYAHHRSLGHDLRLFFAVLGARWVSFGSLPEAEPLAPVAAEEAT